MDSLSKKRNLFHNQIRTQFIQNYFKKIRYQILQHQSTDSINQIIQSTSSQITQQNFNTLIYWANQKDQNNAIIHIGNLLIDQIIDTQSLLKNFQLRPKNSHYWPWLIKIIITLNLQRHYQVQTQTIFGNWQTTMFEYILGRMCRGIGGFCLSQSLEIIKIMLQKQKQSQQKIQLIFGQYSKVLPIINKNCLSSDKLISQHCYQIMDIIIQFGDRPTSQLLQLCTLSQVQHVLIIGLNKLDSSQKKFPLLICRIINNIFSTRIMLNHHVLDACIKISFNKKNNDKTKLQLSYMWQSFFQNCISITLFKQYCPQILRVFETIFLTSFRKQQYLIRVRQNVNRSLQRVLSKAQQCDQNVLMQINSMVKILYNNYIIINKQQKSINRQLPYMNKQQSQMNKKQQQQKQYIYNYNNNNNNIDNMKNNKQEYKQILNNSRYTTIAQQQMDIQQ